MSWKENDDALKELARQVKKIVKYFISKADFDKTYTGIVSAVNNDGYTVKYNGTETNIKTTATAMFKKGDQVRFCVPCSNMRRAYFVVDLDLMQKIMNK